ncbi:15109_t:CDS:2, partial [Racocetra persica]
MSTSIPPEIFQNIFKDLDTDSLYSVILVNRIWCSNAISILWQNPLEILYQNDDSEYFETNVKSIIKTYISCLPKESKLMLSFTDLWFLANTSNSKNNTVILETGISPFRVGASISHVDEKLFNSSDFLMTFEQVLGRTLEDSIAAGGSEGGKEKAIGPKLLAILETLGYPTPNNPNPYRPSLAFPQSSSTESCSSSHCTKAESSPDLPDLPDLPDSTVGGLSSSSNSLSMFNMASM